MQKITLLPKGILQYISLFFYLYLYSLSPLPLSFFSLFFVGDFFKAVCSAGMHASQPTDSGRVCVLHMPVLPLCVHVCVCVCMCSSIQAICHGVGCLLGQSR